MGYSSVVLGWQSSQEQVAFECCAVPKLKYLDDSLSCTSEPSTVVILPKKEARKGLMRFFARQSRKENNQCLLKAEEDISIPNTLMGSLINVECTEPIFEDDRDNYICETREHDDVGHGVECILPSIEFQKGNNPLPFEGSTLLFIPDYQGSESPSGINTCQQEEEDLDDPFSAAKRGDLHALMRYTEKGHDWKCEDDKQCTPLYYACHSGAAKPKGILTVQYLLEQWTGQIPNHVFERCRMNAINHKVVKLLDATKGSLCGMEVDTKSKPKLMAGMFPLDMFGDDGWGSNLLYGENIDDEDRDDRSDMTTSLVSAYFLKPRVAIAPPESDTGSLSYSRCSHDSFFSLLTGATTDK
jgi:hypothetical protein